MASVSLADTPYDVESALRSDIKTIALRASVKELFDAFDASPLQD